ncbi:pseudouridine synthase [Geofilum sp. OHC36d9]|uniref:pseudouridine synthase n=1 Tax=Geofilum sp. OHC36d9 TaxID=3458413 RepID=UPI0040344BB2
MERRQNTRNSKYNRKNANPKFDRQSDHRKHSEHTSAKKNQPQTPQKPTYKQDEDEIPDTIRLNRYISNSGVCSRRDADKLIAEGRVTVNGKVVTELGTKVKLKDDIHFNGKRLNPEAKVYILLNKPKDVVTTASDPEKRRTVLDLVADACDERIYPVGRLDRNTTGLLLLTNDGDLSKKLTHPSSEVRKIYHVYLNNPLTKNHLTDIRKGIELEDGLIEVDEVNYADAEDKCQVGVEIHSGKNRIVRRIFEHLGYRVEKLDRVYLSGLTKKNLPRGKWRYLSNDEVKFLKAGIMK